MVGEWWEDDGSVGGWWESVRMVRVWEGGGRV